MMSSENDHIFKVLGGILLLVIFIAVLPSQGQTSIGYKSLSPANTFTVTNTSSGGPGSLSQAILDANSAPGLDSINFSIGSGPQTIAVVNFPTITDPVIIDGTTQPGFSGAPIIELSGFNNQFDGIVITSGGCTVQGLVINRFRIGITLSVGGNNIVRGNYIGTNSSGTAGAGNSTGIHLESSSSNIIGGTDPSSRNVISGNTGIGLNIFHGQFNQIQGNYIGTNATGTAAIENFSQGLGVTEASNNTIGGTAAGAGNVISGNRQGGVTIGGNDPPGPQASGNKIEGNYIGINAAGSAAIPNGGGSGVSMSRATNNTVGGTVAGARNIISGNNEGVRLTAGSNNLIQGNYIGTDPSGMAALPNSSNGIFIVSASTTTIGGTTAAARNVISGNGQRGIWIYDSLGGTGNQVQGNYIGTKADGVSPLGNGIQGVFINNNAQGNTIGGLDPGAGNVIAFNGGAGVHNDVAGGMDPVGNPILGNNIFSNTGLGIDWFGDGITPNDSGDAGNNNVQNFPFLTSAQVASGGTRITGTLNSRATATFRVEFFANTACDPSGNGEGQRYLGATTVTTDSSGNALIDNTVAASDTAGSFLTATATNSRNFTSEFSPCRAAPLPPPVLMTEPNSTRAIALDSPNMLRDPFSVITSQVLNPDHRTRITLLALNVTVPGAGSTLTAQAQGATGTYPLPVEYVGRVPGFDWYQIVVKLPDELIQNGDVNVSLTFNNLVSNKVLVGIKSP